jgi:hypothetical protein
MSTLDALSNQFWMHESFLELQAFFGPTFKPSYCLSDEQKAIEDRASFSGSDEEWTASTDIFCYQNVALAIQGIHRPYLSKLLASTADRYGPSVLDYGAGGGQVGLGLHFLGYRVSFADIPGRSLMWLIYRLRQLRLPLPVYILGQGVQIPRHNIVLCLDVIEHLSRPEQEELLTRLGEIGEAVFVNLIRDDDHPGIHAPVDFDGLTEFVRSKWACFSEDHYPHPDTGIPRQRLLIYGEAVENA